MDSGTVLRRIVALLAQRGSEDVEAGDRLDDLGLDSIDLVYILTSFERSDDAEFGDADFDRDRYDTVAQLADVIATRING
jgi:acyl carrier protein